ncbi:MAG: hypothetical protein IT214_01405 [Chitinophagaceae bacterium]|nr:hypothetical protein [Chitinophagaceae bacterium]
MKIILLLCFCCVGFTHANAQLLSKIKKQADHTAEVAKTTTSNKMDERTAQAVSQKTDKLMDKMLSAKISFKKKKKQAQTPAADSLVVVTPNTDAQSQKDN